MDNAGENKALQKRMKSHDWKELSEIECEFTARDTPQQNSLAERAIDTVMSRARAMME